MIRRSWVEIDIDRIKANYIAYKALLRQDQKIMAVVKANAYGHGDVRVSLALQEIGASFFAVSNIDEAIKLRNAGITGHILILGYTPAKCFDSLAEYDLTQTVYSEQYADLIRRLRKDVKVQIAIDTGMNRIGLNANDPDRCAELIREYCGSMKVVGIFSHLCAADSDDGLSKAFTNEQLNKFNAVCSGLSDLELEFCHCLNSAGGMRYNCAPSNFIRLGIVLYGMRPSDDVVLPEQIRPALSWRSVVSMVKDVKAGEYVGYGLSYKAERDMKIATIPTGYADGYSRALSNKGRVLIKGRHARIVGKICMDQFMVDVTDIPNVEFEDEVTLIGQGYTADDMAKDINTIGYEVVCAISPRVPKIYK